MLKNLNKYHIILGSSSPRRKKLLDNLSVRFKIKKVDFDEKYPDKLNPLKVAEFIANKKSIRLSKNIKEKQLIITADTIVVLNNIIFGKPKSKIESFNMLSQLSNQTHKVITGVKIKTLEQSILFSVVTLVRFKKLSSHEINHYIENYKVNDKAGSYAIQDWIGKIAVISINGCYTNILGLPLPKLYDYLKLIK